MAPIAGTASSVQGVVGTIGGALIGFVIGQAFDGTAAAVPDRTCRLRHGRRSLLVLWTERGRLFGGIDEAGDAARARRLTNKGAPAGDALPCCDRSASLDIVVVVGTDHQRFADFLGLAADRILDPLRHVGIFLEDRSWRSRGPGRCGSKS